MQPQVSNYSEASVIQTNKVLRNTYMLLSMTLLFSALCAFIAMAVNMPHGAALIMNLVAIGLIWFVLPKTANSGAGIFVVFAFAGLLGAGLGPMLNYYMATKAGTSIVMQALAGTGIIFMSLSAYVINSKKDFSFLGGFLFVGLMLLIVTSLFAMVAGFFGVDVSAVSLAISAVAILIFSGFILYDTSRIVNGGETNYVMATVALYLNIYNLFVHLLHLLGAMSDD